MFINEERQIAFSILEKNGFCFEDVQAFRRYIFDTGLASREEAEMLMTLDRQIGADVPGWRAFFVEAVTDFVVWQSRPTGRVTESDLDWLAGCLTDRPTVNGAALALNILREAHEVPARFVETAERLARVATAD